MTNVDVREGEGVGRLWQNQLMKLPKVTWEVAQSITKVYPIPRSLIEVIFITKFIFKTLFQKTFFRPTKIHQILHPC